MKRLIACVLTSCLTLCASFENAAGWTCVYPIRTAMTESGAYQAQAMAPRQSISSRNQENVTPAARLARRLGAFLFFASSTPAMASGFDDWFIQLPSYIRIPAGMLIAFALASLVAYGFIKLMEAFGAAYNEKDEIFQAQIRSQLPQAWWNINVTLSSLRYCNNPNNWTLLLKHLQDYTEDGLRLSCEQIDFHTLMEVAARYPQDWRTHEGSIRKVLLNLPLDFNKMANNVRQMIHYLEAEEHTESNRRFTEWWFPNASYDEVSVIVNIIRGYRDIPKKRELGMNVLAALIHSPTESKPSRLHIWRDLRTQAPETYVEAELRAWELRKTNYPSPYRRLIETIELRAQRPRAWAWEFLYDFLTLNQRTRFQEGKLQQRMHIIDILYAGILTTIIFLYLLLTNPHPAPRGALWEHRFA